MTTSMEARLTALECPAKPYVSVRDMPTAALEAMLAPLFGGRAPTDDELHELIERAERGGQNGNA